MLLDDAVGDGQAETGPLADLFGSEEWVEDTRQYVCRDAGAGVPYREEDGLAKVVGCCREVDSADGSSIDHRVLGVDEHVEERLLKEQRIADHGWQGRSLAACSLDTGPLQA